MKNLIRKLRQSSIVFEKPGILSKKLKTLTFCSHASYKNNIYKEVYGIIFVLFISGVTHLQKSKKAWFLQTYKN